MKPPFDFTTYPDTWIRDLPLLQLEEGAYIAIKATLGTNICLNTGEIFIDKIILKKNCMIGHLTMLAPGVTIGERAEVGVGSGIGINVNIGAGSNIGPMSTINHYCDIGQSVIVGTKSYIGLRVKISDNIKIPPATNIPDFAIIRHQSDVRKYALSPQEFPLADVF